jgi:Caudovirus prohead serine protease
MTRTVSGPPTGEIAHRFASSASSPASYDKTSHSCDCIISSGAAVSRYYGSEVLRIDSKSVDLSRVTSGGVPLLDSHSQGSIESVLGRIDQCWIKGGQLYGKIIFAQTPAGRQAEGMIARGELKGISAGYSVSDWEISDDDGDVIDPEKGQIRWDDKLTFTATRWQLLEASLVGVPADAASAVRSFGAGASGDFANEALVRMKIRQRMFERQNIHDARRAVIGNTDRPASAWRRGSPSQVFP